MKTLICIFVTFILFLVSCSNHVLQIDGEPTKRIIVTEIMYNNGTDSLEYIELKNVTFGSISLKGMYFSEGISLKFADSASIGSGEYLVLTNSISLFQKHYPSVNVGGVFNGHLNHSGEKVELIDSVAKDVFKVEFQSTGFWPSIANGCGYSLVTADERDPGDQNDYRDWRASALKGGSPGCADNPAVNRSAYVNEVIVSGLPQRVDSVEIFNPDSLTPVDISYWFLTDDRKNPKKYRIPSGTVIAPLSYVVFSAGQFGSLLSVSIGGGEIYLFSASADSEFTGFSHGISYDEAVAGTSFGLIRNSDGHYFTCHLRSSSMGKANSLPLSGPVVISEIMYNPIQGGTEYVEIANVSGDSVNLFAGDTPWKIDGISFSFPPAMTLKKNSILLAISNTTTVASFRSLNHVDSSVIIVQFSGKLDNNGELLSIEKPGNAWVDDNGFVQHSYSTVDAVSYKDSSPWPKGADGGGYSLVRKDLNAWGNEPSNWRKSDLVGGSPGKL